MNHLPFRSSLGLVIALVAGGCLELTYTADGAPIVPFDAAAPPVSEYNAGGTKLSFSLEAWTNRMPGPARPRGAAEGFPVNVSLKVTVSHSTRHADSILVPAISLWSGAGDSLLATFALVRTDQRDPWLNLSRDAETTELTGDPSRRPLSASGPDLLCRPRLAIIDGGRTRYVSLPAVRIAAVY